VLELSHPDLHWFVPIPRPKAGEADRQVDEAADLLTEAISARRDSPIYQASDGMAFHPLASIRLLLRRAALTPVEGGRKVFVLGEADRLVPQESSPEAANALLKFLEEPPLSTWVILTTTEADRVLPTIRSRVVPVRLSRLPDSEAQAFWGQVERPGGMVGNGERGKAVLEARALLSAIEAGPSERFERALKQPPWSARGGFTDLLDALASEVMEQARVTSEPARLSSLSEALHRIETAREEAQGNVNPQLVLADLTAELAEVL
jgi:DNA polymerase-3 subunit delta'